MNIIEALEPYAVDLDSLTPYPKNPRRGRIDRIAASLTRFGQQKPVIVQKSTRSIIARNHVWRAARSLGWTRIAAIFVDVDDVTALQFLVADNRTSDLGDYDDEAVLALLEGLEELDGTGWTADDVEDLIGRMDSGESEAVSATPTSGRDGDVRSIVITMSDAALRRFRRHLDTLTERYETDSDAATIYEAVRREVE